MIIIIVGKFDIRKNLTVCGSDHFHRASWILCGNCRISSGGVANAFFAGVDLGERRSSISGDRGGTADGIIV